MNKKEFYKMFHEVIHNVENKYHPLVWINGDPEIGEGTYIGGFSEINAKNARVKIGRDCDIASFVAINAADSHLRCIGLTEENITKNIDIGNCVFIGSHSVILGGAKIGGYSVVAAGCVVREGDYPPFSLFVGNPTIVKPGYYRKKWEAIYEKHEKTNPT